MLHIKQIVNSIFTSNTYVVYEDEYDYCWLVDIGDYWKVEEALPKNIKVKGLFLTHTHFDHIYGINNLHNCYSECCIYTSEYGKDALFDDKKNLSRYYETPFVYEGSDIKVLKDGDEVEIFPRVYIKAFATPGHCPSCLTYMMGDWLFTGDSYMPGAQVVTKLPKGNKLQAQQSLCRIKDLARARIIAPGHGEMFETVNSQI